MGSSLMETQKLSFEEQPDAKVQCSMPDSLLQHSPPAPLPYILHKESPVLLFVGKQQKKTPTDPEVQELEMISSIF